jgi:hypothetical protein
MRLQSLTLAYLKFLGVCLFIGVNKPSVGDSGTVQERQNFTMTEREGTKSAVFSPGRGQLLRASLPARQG